MVGCLSNGGQSSAKHSLVYSSITGIIFSRRRSSVWSITSDPDPLYGSGGAGWNGAVRSTVQARRSESPNVGVCAPRLSSGSGLEVSPTHLR